MTRLVLAAIAAAAACTPARPPVAEANPMLVSAGSLRGDTLHVALEARMARWYPAAADGPFLEVAAFAESGRAASVPGPLVRVPAGTAVAVRVRNALADTLFLTGLRDPERWDTLVVVPGAEAAVTFRAARPGVYVYAGGTRRGATAHPRGPGEQLSGLVVVDSAGSAPDRLIVLGSWNAAPVPPGTDSAFVLFVNGKTWPHTERIRLQMGDTARWRVVSVSPSNHPMHLHGGYFRVDARGGWRGDTALAPGARRLEATELLVGPQSMSITWTPTRPGRWLFHCHDAFHIQGTQHADLAGLPHEEDQVHADPEHHLVRGMAGLVLGIEVEGNGAPSGPAPEERAYQLDVVERDNYYRGAPAVGFAFPGDELMIPGPMLELEQGRPAAITVRNRLREPASVHWHGMELESYYDGVAGWSGAGPYTAPLIAPGDSFTARFTPPRAGTFIYHSHVAEARHLASGMYAPLVVMPPGERWNIARDHLLIFSQAGPDDSALVVVNGGRTPALPPLAAGVAHRLRFISITAGDVVGLEALEGDGPAEWRPLASDGADLPEAQRRAGPARLVLGAGETYDVEIRPRRGQLRFRVKSFNDFEFPVTVR